MSRVRLGLLGLIHWGLKENPPHPRWTLGFLA